MGKGGGNKCQRQQTAEWFNPMGHARSVPAGTPGSSLRARWTYKVMQEATGLSQEELTRDIFNGGFLGGQPLAPEKVDGNIVVNNAMFHLFQDSIQGAPGYTPELEEVRWELHFAILLDGDRRAAHTGYYGDDSMGGEWNLGAGQALRAWYGFPSDSDGCMDPAGIAATVKNARYLPQGRFVPSLRSRPSATLARCVDMPEPGTDISQLSQRMAHMETASVVLDRLAEGSREQQMIQRLLLRNTLDVLDQSSRLGLEPSEHEALALAAAYSPQFGQQPDSAIARLRALADTPVTRRAAELLEATRPRRAADSDLPVISCPQEDWTAKILADAQQGWMASSWCDLASELQRQASGAPDNVEALARARELCQRSPWHSQFGRSRFQKAAARQETRLRELQGMILGKRGPSQRLKLDKTLKTLTPASSPV